MPRVALEPGENNIDRAAIAKTDGGGYRMQWSVRLLNGRLCNVTTKGKCTKGELRRRAHAKAQGLIATGGGSVSAWKSSSSMHDYIKDEVVPGIERTDDSILRPRTRASYRHVLSLVADASKGFRIADAVRPRNLEEMLVGIARSSGTATAKQCSKTMSKYVLEPLVRDEVIPNNPLKSFKPRLPEHRGVDRPAGGQALTSEERERVMDYLLGIDPNAVPAPKRGRYSAADRSNLRRTVVEITLLQATTGLRINEARLLTKADVGEQNGLLTVTVTEAVSKTHRGRTVPIMDERVAERMRRRAEEAGDEPSALIFPAPAAPGSAWDLNNAEHAIRKLYREMADTLNIPLLRSHSTHVWRATLNTEWMQRGVPEVLRAAYFGHSPEVNRSYYTDTTNISALIEMVRAPKTER
ncbi:MAG: site-specific integrase [Atopobiaceae bacterium]|nr:site-specific integrase [Atopobiaceae bacterium]